MTRSSAVLRMACSVAGVLLFGALAACGGSDSSTPAVHQPSLSNLSYSPTSAMQAVGTTATISGTFAFYDAGADIASVRITSSGGADSVTATPQLGGIAAGTAFGQVLVPLDQPGRYTFEVWVTDSTGSTSNRLSGTFEVVAQIPAGHSPAIANLTFSPNTAPQVQGGKVLVSGSVDFADSGMDVERIELATSWGSPVVLPASMFKGLTSGKLPYAVDVPVTQVGPQTFEVTVFDSQGMASNRLTGTVTVTAVTPS